MASLNQNDTFYANNVRTLAFTIMNNDASPVAPLNLSEYQVQWALSKFLSNGSYSTTPTIQKDNEGLGGVVVTDAANGKCQVNIAEVDTVNLSGTFYHELQLVDGDGNAVVVATGKITILRNIILP